MVKYEKDEGVEGLMIKLLMFLVAIAPLFARSPIDPIPKDFSINKEKAKIGYILFYDPSLSGDGKLSCAHCHKKEYGGANNERFSEGINGSKTKYNVPSIYNLRYQFTYGWEKKEYDLKAKIEDILRNPTIMGADFKKIVDYIKKNSYLKPLFLKNYKKIDKEAIIDTLYHYILSLNTIDSKFDRYLRGEYQLSVAESRGYELFKKYGCIACHNGKTVGGYFYFQYGYFIKEKEKRFFKCPSLRNVEKSAPYFHDGSVKTLQEAILLMAKVQLGRDISLQDAKDIEAFLKTLTGKVVDESY